MLIWLRNRSERIVAVGSNSEIEKFIGEGTEVIDLDGRLATPDFIEGHGHFLALGQSRMILPLGAASSWDEIVQMVEQAATEALPGEWIRGRGWHQSKWTVAPDPSMEGLPFHDSLSAVSPHNPVPIQSYYASVSRQLGNGSVFLPGQRMTKMEPFAPTRFTMPMPGLRKT